MDARTNLLLVICGAAVVVTVHAAVGELFSRSCNLPTDTHTFLVDLLLQLV
jgi:hypothetical protein